MGRCGLSVTIAFAVPEPNPLEHRESALRHTDLRLYARAILQGLECVSPASVYDALSARVASLAGFRLGLLSGSISSATTLAAPDVMVITLTEFAADQTHRARRRHRAPGRRGSRLRQRAQCDEGLEGTVERANAYARAGADAIFVVEFDDIAVIDAVHAAVDLPLIIGSGKAFGDRERLRS